MSVWNLDPLVMAWLGLLGLAYGRGVTVLWRRAGTGAVVARWRVASFALGLYVVALAILSPLDAWAHVLFSAHMVQHVLLMFVAAPLIVLGAPFVPVLWALPRGARRAIGRSWNAHAWLGQAWHALTGPVVVWCVLTTALWVWHLPGPYQAAVRYGSVHALEHATMLGAALLFWWVVLQPTGRRRVDGGSAVLLVFTTKVQSATLGAIITFAPTPIYPVYEPGAALVGMTPLQDQHLAGLIMGTVGGLVFLAAGALVFLGWLRSLERRHNPRGGSALPRVVRGPPLELGR